MRTISIILPFFKYKHYLKECLENLEQSTFKDFELIIWDDASTDESWEIIQSYKDERIKAFRNEESKEKTLERRTKA